MPSTEILKYIEGPPLTGKPRTGWERFVSFVENQPDYFAVTSLHQASELYPSIQRTCNANVASSCLKWTYRDLKTAIDRLTAQLHLQGIEPGMIIVTFLPNGVESVVARLAASIMGCVFAPLNLKHLVNKDEVAYLLRLYLRRFEPIEAEKYAVIITSDAHHASLIEKEQTEFAKRCLVKILCPQPSVPQEHTEIDPALSGVGWCCFEDLMQEPKSPQHLNMFPCVNDLPATDELILCTSGTTSLPKACVWTTSQISYHYHVLEQSGLHKVSSEDNVLICLSNNHIAGYDALSSALFFGGTAIISGPAFDVEEFVQAAVQEHATYTILVPTMVASIARFLESPLRTPLRINLGGDIATSDIVDLCYDKIRAAAVYNTFGNTEGAFLKSGLLDSEQVKKSGRAPTGRPSPGQALKLCAVKPESHSEDNGTQHHKASEVVGELHLSSPGTCSGYLGVAQSSAFYKDEQGREWFATGDQAHVDADGNITIIGRYKDMIIRGGENISPAAVEAVLSSSFASLDIQIVGIPDADGLAGQIPVAVTKTATDPETIMAIRETVRNVMGSASCPEEILSLAQLGLEDYPRTMSKKVKKAELVEMVQQHRAQKNEGENNTMQRYPAPSDTFEKLRATWARVLGIDESSLSPESHMAELADSIAATRLLDRVSRIFGKVPTLAEFKQADTLQEQAALLDSKPPLMANAQPSSPTLVRATGPPEIKDVVHLTGHPEQFAATKTIIEEAISHTGLVWADVREVMPAHDMNRLSVLLGQMNRLNLKACLIIQNMSISKEQLYDALEAAFMNNTQLASFEVSVKCSSSHDQVLHVIVAQTRQFLEQHIIKDGGVLDTVKELNLIASGRQFPDHTDATKPGPLIKVDVYSIRETGTLALLINTNHSVMDAISAQLFYEDLDAALTKPKQPLRPATPYRPWLDRYHVFRSSADAKVAIDYQVEYLQDIGRYRHAIWPTHPPAYLPRQLSKKSSTLDGSMFCMFDVPDFPRLRKQHPEIAPHIPLKVAMALFLMRQTGHTHALFGQTEADRTRWPFWPKSLGERSAADVRGQTLQTVVNIISVRAQETVLAFLQRMQAEQTLQTRHAAAPRLSVMEALGDDGELIPWVANTALFNWSPAKTSATYDAFKVVHLSTNWDVFGLFVMGGLAGEEKLWLQLKGASFGDEDHVRIARELELLTSWLVSPDSWERRAEEFRFLMPLL